jgi:hypothetical protein
VNASALCSLSPCYPPAKSNGHELCSRPAEFLHNSHRSGVNVSNLYRSGAAVLLAAVLFGCAGAKVSRSRQQPIQTPDQFVIHFRGDAIAFRSVVNAHVGEVWNVVPVVYRELGYPGAPAKGESHVFITPAFRIPGRLYPGELNSRYFDCGTNVAGTRADSYDIRFAIMTRLRPGVEGSTIVETAIDGNARAAAHNINYVRCSGTGALERTIGESIARKVAQRAVAATKPGESRNESRGSEHNVALNLPSRPD